MDQSPCLIMLMVDGPEGRRNGRSKWRTAIGAARLNQSTLAGHDVKVAVHPLRMEQWRPVRGAHVPGWIAPRPRTTLPLSRPHNSPSRFQKGIENAPGSRSLPLVAKHSRSRKAGRNILSDYAHGLVSGRAIESKPYQIGDGRSVDAQVFSASKDGGVHDDDRR
jgi:hypothetical protein